MKIMIEHDSRTEVQPTVVFVDTKPADPPPPPPPPPPSITATLVSRVVQRPDAIIMAAMLPDLSGHLLSVGFSDGGRYARYQEPVELAGQTLTNPQGVGPTATIRGFIETTFPQMTFGAAWTASVTLTPRTGSPLITGTVPVAATASEFRVTVDLTKLAEGWYMVGVTGQPPGWGALEYPMYVRQSTTAAPQTHMPVVTGSYTHENNKLFSYAWVPAGFAPTILPLPHRTYPPIAPVMDQLAYTMLVPFTRSDGYRPSKLPSGLWTTANAQNYGFASFYQRPEPGWAVLEGPRGRGNLICPTSLRETKRPDSGKVLFTTPHSVGTVSDDGAIHIEAGYVHDEPVYANWDSFRQQRPSAPRRLVGDWSAVPLARQGFNELWDVAVDERTTALDPSAPPIDGEQPHLGQVVKYVTDTRRDRVCKLTYDGKDREAPPKVEEFLTFPGGKPWGCECVGNLLIVTWSGADVVAAYDMGTSQIVWQFSMQKPQGIRVYNGVAYIGSSATWTIQKLDLTTRTPTKFADVIHNGNSLFVNLAVSALGVAYVTWSNDCYGVPVVLGHDGVRLKIGARNNLGFGEARGTFMPDGLGYASAVSMNDTRITWGTVQDGLHRLSGALPTDAVVPPTVAAGVAKWIALDLKTVWGDYGFGYYGVPLPWGKYGPEVDAMLTNMGHK